MKTVKDLQDCIAYADLVRKKFRSCLLAIGKSPDTHIYDLTPKILEGRGFPKERAFLLKVLAFYEELLPKDKEVFIAEVIERYRHYPYWFLEDYPEKDFAKRKDSVLRKVSYGL